MTILEDAHLDDGIHRNVLRALMRIGSLTSRSRAEHVGPWLAIDAGVDEVRFNIAVQAGPLAGAAAAVDLAERWFAHRAARFRFQLRDTDTALLDELRRRGFAEVDHEPAMAMSLEAWQPTGGDGIVIRRAVSDADIRRYAHVDGPAWHEITEGIARTASTFSDFELLLGESGGEAVATSMAVVTGGIVGIFNVQVQPRARGRGFGTAMTAAAMNLGCERGATTAALQASEMGLPVYRKMGFAQRFRYLLLSRPEPEPAAKS